MGADEDVLLRTVFEAREGRQRAEHSLNPARTRARHNLRVDGDSETFLQ
jgi:hypothetical protein